MVWATMGMYTSYFGNPYMTALPACWQISKQDRKFCLGKKREEGSQIPPAGEELIEEQCLLILAYKMCIKEQIKV